MINNIQQENTSASAETLICNWQGSVLKKETTLHQISPYIGKIKSSMAAALISTFTKKGDTIYDPFSGSGTIALEASLAGRNVIANDLSPYAGLLTRAKLFPYGSLSAAMEDIDKASRRAAKLAERVDLRTIPIWVRRFFHPDTLREIIGWKTVLTERKKYFLLGCLMGILHHQRPGFLSFPSSHTVPYLRRKNFPPSRFPELYTHRALRERLEKKVKRALKRQPALGLDVFKECLQADARTLRPIQSISAIISSPPYMRQLDYGRDNRLRLWFLGHADWKNLDKVVSPSETIFLSLMRDCLKLWHSLLVPDGLCVLVLGDTRSKTYDLPLPDVIANLATIESARYSIRMQYTELIPNIRRVRRGYHGSSTETVLVLEREEG